MMGAIKSECLGDFVGIGRLRAELNGAGFAEGSDFQVG